MATTIYGLFDPISGDLRYIGKTKRKPEYRLAEHLRSACTKRHQYYCARWIRTLSKWPLIKALCVVPNDFANEMEIKAIAHFKAKGYRLTNVTKGGDGNPGISRPVSMETRNKISAAHKGKKLTAEHRAAIGRAGMGKKRSPETRARMSARQYGRPCSEATRQKHRENAVRLDHVVILAGTPEPLPE